MIRFFQDEQGATSVEYALIAAFIFSVIVGAVTAVGTNLTPIFTAASEGFTSR